MVINSCNDMFHDLSIYTVMICSLMLRDLLEQRRFNKQNLNTTWFENSLIQNKSSFEISYNNLYKTLGSIWGNTTEM